MAYLAVTLSVLAVLGSGATNSWASTATTKPIPAQLSSQNVSVSITMNSSPHLSSYEATAAELQSRVTLALELLSGDQSVGISQTNKTALEQTLFSSNGMRAVLLSLHPDSQFQSATSVEPLTSSLAGDIATTRANALIATFDDQIQAVQTDITTWSAAQKQAATLAAEQQAQAEADQIAAAAAASKTNATKSSQPLVETSTLQLSWGSTLDACNGVVGMGYNSSSGTAVVGEHWQCGGAKVATTLETPGAQVILGGTTYKSAGRIATLSITVNNSNDIPGGNYSLIFQTCYSNSNQTIAFYGMVATN